MSHHQYKTDKRRVRNAHWLTTLAAGTVMSVWSILSLATDAIAQDGPALSPPVNHEVGRIEALITAADNGYRYRGYVLAWRSTRIVVAGPLDDSHTQGGNLDIVVYRANVDGHKVLRFVAASSFANDDEVDRDSAGSSAAITQGTAAIDETVSAESDGYRFVGYFVSWHNQRVFVVDPRAMPALAPGETINFRVLRTGMETNQRLSFSM
jgi:hypothetical protein